MRDQPPGYALHFDRFKRKWRWKHEASGIESDPYDLHEDCRKAAYSDLRARRSADGTGGAKPDQTLADA